VLWLESRPRHRQTSVHDVPVLVRVSTVIVVSSAHDIGVVIDSRLTVVDNVASVCRFVYCQIRPTTQSLSADAAKALVQAFISITYWTTVTWYRDDHENGSTLVINILT